MASVLVTCLSGCVAAQPFQLIPPGSIGKVPVMAQILGHGDKRLGTFTAGGTVTVWGRCSGPGNLTVSMGSKVGSATIGCSRVVDDSSSSIAVAITLPPNTTFPMTVHAAPGTSWILAAAATKR